MISLLKYGLAGYGAYMLYRQYIVKDIGKVAQNIISYNKLPEENITGYIHSPLQP
jgi:hypothetical protein